MGERIAPVPDQPSASLGEHDHGALSQRGGVEWSIPACVTPVPRDAGHRDHHPQTGPSPPGPRSSPGSPPNRDTPATRSVTVPVRFSRGTGGRPTPSPGYG